MIHWYKDLYLDDHVKKHVKRYKKRIESDKIIKKHCTIITLASNQDDLFDIFDTKELYFPYHKRRDIYVVGIATDEESALLLLQKMLLDVLKKEKSFSPRKHFSKDRFQKR